MSSRYSRVRRGAAGRRPRRSARSPASRWYRCRSPHKEALVEIGPQDFVAQLIAGGARRVCLAVARFPKEEVESTRYPTSAALCAAWLPWPAASLSPNRSCKRASGFGAHQLPRVAACDDSDAGFCMPPADRLLVTGIPKMAVPIMTSTTTARMRFGAPMASRRSPAARHVLPPSSINRDQR